MAGPDWRMANWESLAIPGADRVGEPALVRLVWQAQMVEELSVLKRQGLNSQTSRRQPE